MSVLMRAALVATTLIVVVGCNRNDKNSNKNSLPDFIKSAIVSTTYDGVADDLLTAGLGKTGLAGASPVAAIPATPTVAELRKIAIWNNYRALVDIQAKGGYGTLYGPNVDASGAVTASEGKIAGEEHIAYSDDGSGRQNVTLMVQIPSTFTVANACIVTATSSGSRGVYGAIATAGEWGLKKGCAVAYTDKGTGNGGHDLTPDMVYVMQGTRTAATTAGNASQFTANITGSELVAFNTASPNRWAFKHAHSQQNPEKDWGRDTLRAVEFAFYVLNQKYGIDSGTISKVLFKENTIVIASSVSNGGGAAIAAAELDNDGLIDGVAVGEPQIYATPPAGVTIRRGATAVTSFGRPLYDYFTLASLYQPCAAVAPAAAGSAGILGITTPNVANAGNRCAALAAQGLVTGTTTEERATDSLNRLLAAGWEADSIPFQASHYSLATLAVAVTYGNSFAKASVAANLCGYSFGGAPTAGVPALLSATAGAQLFGTGNGVPPTSGIAILNNSAVGGAASDAGSVSASTGLPDFNVAGAVCLRNLFTSTTDSVASTLRASIDETKRNGNLRGKPAVIVHGRADTLVPVNHSSRPYYALSKTADSGSRLAYYEVTNAQHFDAFIDNAAAPGYDTRVVPLHVYFNRAMDIVYNNLKNGTAIPASQVVRGVPRGGTAGAAPPITAANVPPIAATPAAADTITFTNNTLTIPD